MHLWRIASELIPTKVSRGSFVMNRENLCPLCSHHEESIIHLFWECAYARAIWFGSLFCIRTDYIFLDSSSSLIELLLAPPPGLCPYIDAKNQFVLIGAIILDQIWKVRNLKVHNEKDPDMVRALRDINNHCREFGALRYVHFSPSRVG